jgi:hypothetical protein
MESSVIYIPLLDEGVPVVRPTRGRPLGQNQFLVLSTPDYDPGSDEWEFEPGSVVTCVLERHDVGDILVARKLCTSRGAGLARSFLRHSLPAVERKLSEMLGLHWDSTMQDWDVESGTRDVLPRVIPLLSNTELSDDERFSAMRLAVACYDHAVHAGAEGEVEWSSIRNEIERRPELYASIVWYWAERAIVGEEAFPISGAKAEVWNTVEAKLSASLSR